MIGLCFNFVGLQHLGELFHVAPAEAIDDTAFAVVLFDKADDVFDGIFCLGPYFVVEVGTVERTFVFHGIDYAKTLFDVCAHLVGGGGSECDDRCSTYFVDNGSDFAVFRSEVVSPLRDAVGLVYGIKRDLCFFEESNVLFFGH